jgi:peptide/nickel transport system substrate-binding protein
MKIFFEEVHSMKFWKLMLIAGLSVVAVFAMVACSPSGDDAVVELPETETEEISKYGGVYTMASTALPHLDPNRTTGGEMVILSINVYEGLYELNGRYEPQPALATGVDISDDGKTYTFTLREGIMFHDGSAMTSADVVASFEYWAKYNAQAKDLVPGGELLVDFGANGDYEFYVELSRPHAPFLSQIANNNQKMIIYPQSVVEGLGDDDVIDSVEKAIGTGPYMVTEWVPDQYLHLERFEDYVPFSDTPSGDITGGKFAFVDKINLEVVIEETTRIAGIQTGILDYGHYVSVDNYQMLVNDPSVEVFATEADTHIVFTFNCGEGPMQDIRVRQAVVAAMDIEEQAIAARGADETFWELDGSFTGPNSVWYIPNAGVGIYNSQDRAKAQRLLQEAGYDGSPVRILYVADNSEFSAVAQVMQQQLEAVGFNVELAAFDRPTVIEKRGAPDQWEIHISIWFIYVNDPMSTAVHVNRNGWVTNWDDEDALITEEIFKRLGEETDFNTRYSIHKEWHDEFLRTAPHAKGYAYPRLIMMNPRVQDYWVDREGRFPAFMGFNVWLEQ